MFLASYSKLNSLSLGYYLGNSRNQYYKIFCNSFLSFDDICGKKNRIDYVKLVQVKIAVSTHTHTHTKYCSLSLTFTSQLTAFTNCNEIFASLDFVSSSYERFLRVNSAVNCLMINTLLTIDHWGITRVFKHASSFIEHECAYLYNKFDDITNSWIFLQERSKQRLNSSSILKSTTSINLESQSERQREGWRKLFRLNIYRDIKLKIWYIYIYRKIKFYLRKQRFIC